MSLRFAICNWRSTRRSARVTRQTSLVVLLLAASVCAQPAQPPGDDIPPLAPPLPELPATFWEQHGLAISGCVIALMAFLCALLWFLLRAVPVPPVRPEVRARLEIEPLIAAPETGRVLSAVSQSLRRYVVDAFGLPPGEKTTAEFCAAIAAQEAVGPDLAAAISDFLKSCDTRKFAPEPVAAPLGAARRALELMERAEARRAQMLASMAEFTRQS